MLAPNLLRSALVLVNTRVDRVLGELQRAQQLTDTGLRALTQLFWSKVGLHSTFERDLDKRLNYERGVDPPTPPDPSAAQVLPLCPVRPPRTLTGAGQRRSRRSRWAMNRPVLARSPTSPSSPARPGSSGMIGQNDRRAVHLSQFAAGREDGSRRRWPGCLYMLLAGTGAGSGCGWLSGRAAACQIRAASRTIAAANGSTYKMTTGPADIDCWATSRPAKNSTASQRGTLRLRHSANPMRAGAGKMPMK